MLTSLHTAFLRMHNKLAAGLKGVMEDATEDEIFMEARQINIAVFQHISFTEFMPLVIGNNIFDTPDLFPLPPGQQMGRVNDDDADNNPENAKFGFDGFPSKTDPSIRNEFGAALFRWGHSMQRSEIFAINEMGTRIKTAFLRDNFFDPQILSEASGVTPGQLIRAAAREQPMKMSSKWIEDTVHMFFKPNFAAHGIDLQASM